MGQRRHGGNTKQHAINELVMQQCINYENEQRLANLEDSKKLINYEAESMQAIQSQPLVTFGYNMNVNLNIDINSNMTAQKLQELFNVINANTI